MKPSIKVMVETYSLDAPETDTPDSERVIDHADGIHRQWLEKHIFWGIRNNREIRVYPIGDEDETH